MQFRSVLAGLALAGLLSTPLPVSGKVKEIPLKASSNWLVDWSDHSCVLARKFGTAKAPVLLSMRAYQPGYRMEMLVAGRDMSAFQGGGKFTISFGSGEPITVDGFQTGRSGDYGPSVIFSQTMRSRDSDDAKDGNIHSRPFPDLPFEAQLDHISLATSYRKVVLKTGPMAKALDNLRQCTDDLVKKWGLDPAVQAGLTSFATPNNQGAWARQIQASFPSELSIEGKEARVNVLVIVDEAGKPTDCDTWQAFVNTEFKVRACGIILRNARFSPALDKEGRPTRSYFTTVILYMH